MNAWLLLKDAHKICIKSGGFVGVVFNIPSPKTDQSAAVASVPAVNQRLSNSHGDVKVGSGNGPNL